MANANILMHGVAKHGMGMKACNNMQHCQPVMKPEKWVPKLASRSCTATANMSSHAAGEQLPRSLFHIWLCLLAVLSYGCNVREDFSAT